jgi:hypothetical protein
MAKVAKTAFELKKLIAEEFRKSTADSVDEDSLVLLRGQSGWLATLRRDGPRIDESRLAAISEVSRRLADGFDLDGPIA